MGMGLITVSLGGQSFLSGPNPSNWWLLSDGLKGWDDSADPRARWENIPGQDGDFMPSEQLVAGREITLSIAHRAETEAIARSEVQQWAAALVKRTDLRLEVEESFGHRSARVWVKSRVRMKTRSHRTVEFEFVLHAPDPRKYGPVRVVSTKPAGGEAGEGLEFPLFEDGVLEFGAFAVAGGFVMSNSGTADSWPVFRVRGEIDSDGFLIQSGTDQLRFEAAVPLGKELVLSPYAGGRAILGGVDVSSSLTVADWRPVLPGEIRQFAFSAQGTAGDSARLDAEIRDAWW